jgi:hypothetical protein
MVGGIEVGLGRSKNTMSLTMIMAFCILGCDFLLYALFYWVYADRRGKTSRQRQFTDRTSRTYPAMRGVAKYR